MYNNLLIYIGTLGNIEELPLCLINAGIKESKVYQSTKQDRKHCILQKILPKNVTVGYKKVIVHIIK